MKQFLFKITIISVFYSATLFAQDISAPAKFILGDDSMYQGSKNYKAVEFYNKAVIEQGKDSIENAIEFYKKALEIDSNYVLALDNIGICYRRLGKADLAIDSYQKSIAIFPKGTFAHVNLALIYSLQEKTDLAIIEYEKVVKLNPSEPEGYFGLAMMYFNNKDADNAILNAKECVRLYKASESGMEGDGEYLLAQSYYLKEEDEKAKYWFKRAKENGVDVPDEFMKFANEE